MINDISTTTSNTLHELTRYVNFHSHPHGSFYNTIDGIIAPAGASLAPEIKLIMNLLGTDSLLLNYSKDSVESFLRELAQALELGKTVFISTNTVNIDPISYDQLMSIRQNNRLNVHFVDDLRPKPIHPDAKLFMVFNGVRQEDISKVYELTDHVLNLGER